MRRRFIIILILAILPIALLTSGQAIWRLVHAYETAEADLKFDARLIASDEVTMIASAEAVLRTLKTQTDIRTNAESCSPALLKALSGTAHYTNIFVLDASGRIQCSALPVDASQSDRSGQPWWQDLRLRSDFFVSRMHMGLVSKTEVLTAALPLFDQQGRFDGALAVGIRVDNIRQALQKRELPKGAATAILDSAGAIVAFSGAPEMQEPFAGLEFDGTASIVSAIDRAGNRWMVALEPVGVTDLLMAFAEREDALFIWSYVDVGLNILLPLAMLAIAFWVIWTAADRLVLRWVAYLQRVARAYGKGHLAFRPAAAVKDAPQEIRQLAEAMGEMAESIRQRDASLRSALEQRSLMLREIHHRVKNNLQIIGSLLQIEARNLEEPAARAALKITRTRINAIALAHRLLEEVDAQTVVNLRKMLTDLVRLLHDAFGEGIPGDELRVSSPDLLIETDVAVPLALLMVEILSDIYVSAVEDSTGALALDVALDRADDHSLRLTIASDGAHEKARQNDGPDFTAAYLRQLRATLDNQIQNGRRVTTLIFQERSADTRSPKLM